MLPIVLLSIACSPHAPPPGAQVAERVDLAEALSRHVDRPEVVGVTIDPDDGEILLLDAREGLFTLEGVTIADEDVLDSSGGKRPFTDVAALGGRRYAVTVRGEGLLFDEATRETSVHFCYLPDSTIGGTTWSQLTSSVAYDAEGDLLYAQPQTWEFPKEKVTAADVGRFDGTHGTPIEWAGLRDEEFLAGALAVDSGGGLFFGHERRLSTYAFGDDRPETLFDLDRFDIGRIEGLAIDPATDALWVVDGDTQELIAISGWR